MLIDFKKDVVISLPKDDVYGWLICGNDACRVHVGGYRVDGTELDCTTLDDSHPRFLTKYAHILEIVED